MFLIDPIEIKLWIESYQKLSHFHKYYIMSKSVWYGAVLRGDVNKLTVGDQSSIGDRAVVHVAKIQGDFATSIGNMVTIGAGAIIHAATIHDKVMIGESAQVLDGAVVESNSIVEPGAIVTPGTLVNGGELWSGCPAKKVRALTEEEIALITATAKDVLVLASKHATENAKDYAEVQEDELKAEIEEYLDPSLPHPLGIHRVSCCFVFLSFTRVSCKFTCSGSIRSFVFCRIQRMFSTRGSLDVFSVRLYRTRRTCTPKDTRRKRPMQTHHNKLQTIL